MLSVAIPLPLTLKDEGMKCPIDLRAYLPKTSYLPSVETKGCISLQTRVITLLMLQDFLQCFHQRQDCGQGQGTS